LVRSIVQPSVDEGEKLVRDHENRDDTSVPDLLTCYFDFHYRHRKNLMLVLTELGTLGEFGMIEIVLSWRQRLVKLVFGPRPTLDQAARAVIAFGGIQDRCLQLADAPYKRLRAAAVDGALAALGMAAPQGRRHSSM
jgi:hypothetical protein